MKTALVIFNGVKLPLNVAERAIEWAKNNSAELQLLFLAGHEKEEGYAFPSDLDAAQKMTDKEDAERDDLAIINSEIKLLEDMAKAKKVPLKTELLIDPAFDDVLARAANANMIFTDSADKEPGPMSVTSFNLQDVLKESGKVARI